MKKKKMNRAEKVKKEIEILKTKVTTILKKYGYSGDRTVVFDIIELMIDYRGGCEDRLIEKLGKKLLK